MRDASHVYDVEGLWKGGCCSVGILAPGCQIFEKKFSEIPEIQILM